MIRSLKTATRWTAEYFMGLLQVVLTVAAFFAELYYGFWQWEIFCVEHKGFLIPLCDKLVLTFGPVVACAITVFVIHRIFRFLERQMRRLHFLDWT